MKRINPLLTANNPAPIPGCHAPVKAIAHSAVVSLSLFLSKTIYTVVHMENLDNFSLKSSNASLV
jgi:hypothetical protein